MRHSMTQWLDWVMNNLSNLGRPKPTERAIHIRYEKAGLLLYGPPVPWNAECVIVEVLAKLPIAMRTRTDFTLRIPGQEPVVAETIRREEGGQSSYRLFFRVPVPPTTLNAELLWKQRLITTTTIVVQTSAEFLAGLRVTLATVAVRLGDHSISAQTFIASQCRGLTTSIVLRSSGGLSPIADLGLQVVFAADRGGEQVVAVSLSSSQLGLREALISATIPKPPRRAGSYTIRWLVGGKELHSQRVTAISPKRFVQSLRVSDARFVIEDSAGVVKIVRHAQPQDARRLGPCFALASKEIGAAALLPLQVTGTVPGAVRPPVLLEQTVLITDGPTVFSPGMINWTDLGSMTGFELRYHSRVIGVATLCPVPAATFNAEGAFKPPPDFAWTPAAEDELAERLAKLMGGDTI